NGCAFALQHVGVLGEEERRRPLVIAHLADMLEIVAPDAPDAAYWKRFLLARDRDRGLLRGGDDKGRCVHEALDGITRGNAIPYYAVAPGGAIAFSSESQPRAWIEGWPPVRVKKTRQNNDLELRF